MRYLVNSDVVAEYLKGRPGAVDLLTRLALEGIAISLITCGEMYDGIYHGSDPEGTERGFREFLRGGTVMPLTQRIMRHFADIRGELRRRGQLIPDPDLLIAATAIDRELALVTRNLKDFRRIPGLDLYEPR